MKVCAGMKRFICVTFGSVLFALGFALFIEPANIAPGGLAGIVVIISRLFPHLSTGALFLVLNIPILLIGAVVFGLRFFLGTVYATVISSITMSVCSAFAPSILQSNVLVVTLIGSFISGIGLALVFRVDATTGGTDIIARLIHKRFAHIRLGWIFFILDAAVILLSGIVFGEFETVLLSAISAAVMSFVFNKILYINFSRQNNV